MPITVPSLDFKRLAPLKVVELQITIWSCRLVSNNVDDRGTLGVNYGFTGRCILLRIQLVPRSLSLLFPPWCSTQPPDCSLFVCKVLLTFFFVVGHAPCLSADKPLDHLQQWWDDLRTHLARVPSDAPIVVCLDANAPLADASTEYFGQHQAEPANAQGRLFQQFLSEMQFYVPATFPTHRGPGATWRHPRGHFLRRDYVLVNRSAFALCSTSCVLVDFDNGFGHQDHVPAMLSFHGFLAFAPPGSKLRWDFTKMQSSDARRRFELALASLPVPTWHVDVDSHARLFESNLVQLAQQHFGAPPRARQRPVLQEATLNGIQLKRQALDLLRRDPHVVDSSLLDELKAFERLLRPMVLHDQQAWYADWLDGIADDHARCDSAQVFRKLQRLGRRKNQSGSGPRPLPMLRANDGQLAQSIEQCQQIWCDQFSALEAGTPVQPAQLLQLHHAAESSEMCSPDQLMSSHEILAVIRRMKSGKVPGPGMLPVDVLKAGGHTAARLLLPLITKATCYLHEPISWKGGVLVPLFKGKGSPQDAGTYRSIFVSDVCAKVHHTHVRKALVDTWTASNDVIQQGGRKGCSTDTAHHLLHGYFAWARDHHTSCALLFVDLHAAFYTVVRSMFLDQPLHDDLLCSAMQRLGITAADWHDILALIAADRATENLDSHTQGLLNDMFTGTHFCMRGLVDPIATFRGTRPGDPVADILFNMAFRLIVLDARKKFQASSPIEFVGTPAPIEDLTSVSDLPPAGFAEVTFVDDIAYALHAPSATQVVHALQLLASCLHDAATARGMQLNYAEGKTEAMVYCAGPGARAVRAHLWHVCDGHLPIVTEHSTMRLRLVHAYKHLGSYIQCQAVVHREVTYRTSQARKAFGQLARPFYSKRNVRLHTKAQVFQALVLARHTFNVHVWSWATERDIQKWANGLRDAIASLVRSVVWPVPPFHFTVTQLFALANLSGPLDLLHSNRLRYVKRALATVPALLWRVVLHTHHASAWKSALQQSLSWFNRHYPHRLALPIDDVLACLQLIALDERWSGRVRNAQDAALRYNAAQAHGLLWTRKIEQQLQALAEKPVMPTPACAAQWQCRLCNAEFESRTALAVHSRQIHGYVQMLKYYVLSDECLACGKKFFQRCRALAHCQASLGCQQVYFSCLVPASDELVVKLAEEDLAYAQAQKKDGWRATKAFMPPVRIPCPLLPPAQSAEARHMRDKWTTRFPDSGSAFQSFEGTVIETDPQEPPDDAFVPFLGQTAGGHICGHAGIFQTYGLAAEAARLHIKCLLFVHFYSGYRRDGDLQHCIEAQHTIDGAQLYCLSVDLCLAKKQSDLTDPSARRFWTDQLHKGQIIGVGGGPSCETWSAARYLPNGPPPVRSYLDPWGLPNLSRSASKQVTVGSALVQFLLDMLVLAARRGLCGFLEHPAYAHWLMHKQPPSVWTLRAFRCMARLQCCRIVTFDQCIFGLRAVKPTTLMLLRLSTFADIVATKGHRGRCNHPGGHQPLCGHQVDGEFATARAKVYPRAMNCALALAVSRFLSDVGVKPSTTMSAQLEELNCTEMVGTDLVQPDYHQVH